MEFQDEAPSDLEKAETSANMTVQPQDKPKGDNVKAETSSRLDEPPQDEAKGDNVESRTLTHTTRAGIDTPHVGESQESAMPDVQGSASQHIHNPSSSGEAARIAELEAENRRLREAGYGGDRALFAVPVQDRAMSERQFNLAQERHARRRLDCTGAAVPAGVRLLNEWGLNRAARCFSSTASFLANRRVKRYKLLSAVFLSSNTFISAFQAAKQMPDYVANILLAVVSGATLLCFVVVEMFEEQFAAYNA